jgi:hypothetical protein
MSPKLKQALLTLATVAVSAAVNALVAVQFDYTGQWKYIAMTIGTAVLTLILNWINPAYPQYGWKLKPAK